MKNMQALEDKMRDLGKERFPKVSKDKCRRERNNS